jgi:very-short-patch-repair endonuclease
MNSLERFDQFVSRYAYKPAKEVPQGDGPRPTFKYFSRRGESTGERLVRGILDKDCSLRYKIDYLVEFVIEEDGRRLRFDFYLPRYRLMIEFDGDQHYGGSRFHRTREDWLDAVRRDEVKNNYCKREKISLLRIPQAYARHTTKLKTLITDFIKKVETSLEPIIELDLYFKIKSGQIIL